MDKFVAWSDATGLAMSYFDSSNMPEGKLAKEFTLCDNFFHAAFGGSFLNHIWFIAAASPKFPHPAPNMIAVPPGGPGKFSDAQVTPDGYAVNTVFSVNLPHRRNSQGDDIFAAMAKLPTQLAPKQLPTQLLPNQTMPTIGDRLSEKGIDWAWYSGGWDRAMAADPDPQFNELFQFHHQPFVYFANFADGTAAKAKHLQDEKNFEAALLEKWRQIDCAAGRFVHQAVRHRQRASRLRHIAPRATTHCQPGRCHATRVPTGPTRSSSSPTTRTAAAGIMCRRRRKTAGAPARACRRSSSAPSPVEATSITRNTIRRRSSNSSSVVSTSSLSPTATAMPAICSMPWSSTPTEVFEQIRTVSRIPPRSKLSQRPGGPVDIDPSEMPTGGLGDARVDPLQSACER